MTRFGVGSVLLGALLFSAPPVSWSQGEDNRSEMVRTTLQNGLRVVVVRDTLAPVATTVMNYEVGSNEAPAGYPGMAHAQEHMMFRGSPGLSADQLAEISAAMGGRFDADTQQVVTQYFFTVPSEDLDVALHVESIRMRGVLDTEALWKAERPAIEQEVAQDLSNPEYVLYTQLLEAMFAGTPYAHDALGTRPSFSETTAGMLRDFYRKWYAPNNAVLVVVGNVQPQSVLAKVEQLFSDIPKKTLPERPEVALKPVQSKALNLTTDLPYGVAIVSFRMPGSTSPDYAPARLLADVLSSQRGTLYALVPEGKALFAGFSLSGLPAASLGYAAAAYPKGGDGTSLIQQMKAILEQDARSGVSPDLVEAARRRELVQAEFEKNSVPGLAMAWSQAIAVEGRQSPDVHALEKVTVADVNRIAREYLQFDHAITAVLTPQPSGEPLSSSSFGGRESLAPKQTVAALLPDWASNALGRLDVPASSVHPEVTTLSNGLQIIFQRETVSNTVSVYGRIRNNPDIETPTGKEGVSSLLDGLFEYGTKSLDRVAFQKALDEIGANQSAGDSFSLQVLPAQFERGVELLADNELNPALPESALPVVRRQLAGEVAGELESPDFLMEQALGAALYPKHDPTLRHATPETVEALSLGDVQAYYRRTFRPDLTYIVVMGNISGDEAKRVISKYFGAWNATGPPPDTTLPPVPLNRASVTSVPNASRVQDKVALAETLGINRFSPDYYPLQLGNHVLGGGFYATRLYRDLRENGGLVYFVASSLDAGKTRATYRVQYGCDPPNVSKARAIIEQDLRAMQTAPPSAAELQQAKALLLRAIPLSESSVDAIAAGMISRLVVGLPLDEPVRAARKYVELTPADVQAAFAKWIRPKDLVQVSQGPLPH